MAGYTQDAGGMRRVRLDVPVRAWWSRPRAWHGEKLTLHVETAYLEDNTPFKIRIFEACDVETDELEPIDTLDKGLVLVKNRAAVPYELAWDRAARGKPLALRGDGFEFFFEVTIDRPRVVGRSNLLYVHLHPHVVSG